MNGCHCREWLGSTRGGYGRLWDGERLVDAHRLAREVATGEVPKDRVLHRCDNPPCVEEAHLWEGSARDNTADMILKGRHLAGREIAAAKVRGLPCKTRGEKHAMSKLTDEEAAKLKRYITAKRGVRVNLAAVARAHGVSASLLYGIRDGRNWGWL